MRNCFVYIGSIIDPKYAAEAYTYFAAVGKGRYSPLNNMVYFGLQGDNVTQFCIVGKGRCFIMVLWKKITQMKYKYEFTEL